MWKNIKEQFPVICCTMKEDNECADDSQVCCVRAGLYHIIMISLMQEMCHYYSNGDGLGVLRDPPHIADLSPCDSH